MKNTRGCRPTKPPYKPTIDFIQLISTLCDASVSSNDNIYGIVNNIIVTLVQFMKANNLYMPPLSSSL